LYYKIQVNDATGTESLINDLNSLDIVEIAYPEPIPHTAMANPTDIPPTTPNFASMQGYLNAPPQGIGAQGVWASYPFSRGDGVNVVDVEFGWNVNHEDLKLTSANVLGGTNSFDNHGTAVLGEIIGYNNNYGVTGIASNVGIGMVSVNGLDDWQSSNISNALNLASSYVNPGDIILTELQIPGPGSGSDPNDSQFGFVPVEYNQANFDVIKTATANGKIVVEPAGNGSKNLDDSIYVNLFNRSYRDSGAIIVGAGTYTIPHLPLSFTNYGNRVDLQGWGENVTTTGYTDLFYGGLDINQGYTAVFSGTSSASPIVVGSASVVQGYYKNVKGSALNAYAMRQLLVNTGTAQAGTNHIGPLPNVQSALIQNLPISDTKANGSDGPISVYRYKSVNITIGLNPGGFLNTEADWWFCAYIQQLNTWYFMNSSGQWTTQAVPIYQGPLFSLSPGSIFNSTLTPGYTYVFYFGVDLNKNGIIDNPLYADAVTVMIY
jgi:hypothetical protein